MRNILAVIVLGSVLLGCTPPASAPPDAGFATDAARPLDISAISAQPLAAAPLSGRVIGAPVAAPSSPQISSAAPSVAPLPATSESPAAIGAAATQILRAPASPEETLCLAQGGRWGKAGAGGAQTCFRPAKDAGKQCSKQSDCTTQCLARSGSCAPFWPIFGCTEVMQNNGSVARLCLE